MSALAVTMMTTCIILIIENSSVAYAVDLKSMSKSSETPDPFAASYSFGPVEESYTPFESLLRPGLADVSDTPEKSAKPSMFLRMKKFFADVTRTRIFWVMWGIIFGICFVTVCTI